MSEQPEKEVAVIVVEDVKPAEIFAEDQKENNINIDAFSFEAETVEIKDVNKDVEEVQNQQKQNVSINDDLEFNEPEVKDDFDFETSYDTFADFQKSLMQSGFLKEEPKEVEIVEEPKEETKKVKSTKVKVEKVTVETSSTESIDRKGGRPKKATSANDIEDLF